MKILEIGCGEVEAPVEGIDYLDIRRLAHVNLVMDARKLTGIKSNSYDLIVAKDIIEHIGWCEVLPTLKEWRRVLRVNGKLEIETPSALELMEIIFNPRNPNLRRLGEESDFEYFSRVAFGHQDYEDNFHKSYFREEWLKELLYKASFKSVEVMGSDMFRFVLEATK